jgi:isopenicillin-N epimerase
LTFGKHWRHEFPLEPGSTYLNHGTVGVTPRRVLDHQRTLMEQIERQPSRFLLRELASFSVGESAAQPRMRAAADAVAAFLGGRGEDLVFVDNATTGINAVLRSFPFEPGDELLVTDLGYGGVARAAEFATRERGASLRAVTMPYPATADALERAWLDAIGPRTRLAIVDHISAESALVFPVAAIAAGLRSRGVAVLVDGAHAPGAIPLDIPALGADYYVANLHKWMWTPRSSGILWAAPDRQAGLHPTVISWGLDQGFTAEFDLVGTRDPSAHLSAPAAIALFHEWGLDDIRRYNHRLACDGARHLAARWATEFSTPDALIGTMATVALPTAAGTVPEDAVHLRTRLLEEDGIEVQMHAYRDRVRARISAQIYNDMDDIERFAAAVLRLVA